MSTMKEQATHEAPPATHCPWTACGCVQGAIGRRAGQGATLALFFFGGGVGFHG